MDSVFFSQRTEMVMNYMENAKSQSSQQQDWQQGASTGWCHAEFRPKLSVFDPKLLSWTTPKNLTWQAGPSHYIIIYIYI